MATWNAAYEALPPGTLESGGLGDDRIRSWKAEIGSRFNQEHKWSNTSSTGQGKHHHGSTRTYYQAAAPTLRPDALTALGALDDGRLYVDSDNSYLFVWNGSTFVQHSTGELLHDQSGGTALKVKRLGPFSATALPYPHVTHLQVLHGLDFSTIRAINFFCSTDGTTFSNDQTILRLWNDGAYGITATTIDFRVWPTTNVTHYRAVYVIIWYVGA